jgi:hypothetical protein
MNNYTHIPFKYSEKFKENDADLQHGSILNENFQTKSLSNMMIPLKEDKDVLKIDKYTKKE